LANEICFHRKTTQKLIRKHGNKNKISTSLKNIETGKPNKLITLTYTENETTKLAKVLKIKDRNLTITLKINNKLSSLIKIINMWLTAPKGIHYCQLDFCI
jgi:hypothetical protein